MMSNNLPSPTWKEVLALRDKVYLLEKYTEAAINYIDILEDSADGYYRVEESLENKVYHKALEELKKHASLPGL